MSITSTFFGLNIGTNGLATFQAAINTTANNVANVRTEGYSKQKVTIEANEALRTHTGYGTLGMGSIATAVEQLRDIYYDQKYWQNNAVYNEYNTKDYYLAQFEEYFRDDDTVDGFSTIYSKMYTSLETLKTQASQYSSRQSYVGTAESLCTYFNNMSDNLKSLQEEINEVIYTDVEAINSLADKIADVTRQIHVIELTGQNANELRDERALLIDDLSQYVNVEATETVASEDLGTHYYKVTINGSVLVSNDDVHKLICVERQTKVNQSDADGLYEIYWADRYGKATGTEFIPTIDSAGGALKSLFLLRDGNNKEGFTGTVGSFGTYNYQGTDGTVYDYSTVTITNPSQTDITDITVPEEGRINLHGKYYYYSGFDMSKDSSGAYTYTFYITNTVDSGVQSSVSGKSCSIGRNIDYMGIPYYQSQFNGFMREFAQRYNTLSNSGQDAYGNTGNKVETFYVSTDKTGTIHTFGNAYDDEKTGILISTYQSSGKDATAVSTDQQAAQETYYDLLASDVNINKKVVKDANLVVCATTTPTTVEDVEKSDLVDKLYSLCVNEKMFRNTTGDSFLQCVISDVAVDAQEATLFSKSYGNIVDSIVSQRTSVSGVDEDEEALDLVKFKNAYDLSSKLIQTLSEMYDRLITQTGV